MSLRSLSNDKILSLSIGSDTGITVANIESDMATSDHDLFIKILTLIA